MRAWQLGDLKGYEGLVLSERPEPEAGVGEVIVRVRASGLNYRDLGIAAGAYPAMAPGTRIPLSDGAGEVVSVGPGVANVKVGDRVSAANIANWVDGPISPASFGRDVGVSIDGWLTEYASLPAQAVFKLPDNLSFEDAASMTVAGGTAWNILVELGGLKAGHVVLTQGTGGVSMFALQIGKMFGAQVAITSSSDEKLSRAKALGADFVVNYKTTPDWEKSILDQTGGRGADITVETGGMASLGRSIAATAVNGKIGLIGNLAGRPADGPNLLALVGRNIALKGITSASRRMMEDWFRAASANALKPVIDARFKFAHAREAYAALKTAQHMGKIVILNE